MKVLHLDSGADMRGGQWQILRLIEGLGAKGHGNILLARARSPLFCEAQKRGWEAHELSLLSVAKWSREAALLHAHDARSHTAAVLAGGAPRLVVSRRVAFAVESNPVSQWKYRRAAHYIAVSEFVKRTLVDAGIAASKITVVHDGVPMRPLAGGSEILVPYSRDPAKGMDLALEAANLAGFPARVSHNLDTDLAKGRLFLYITHSEGLGSAVLLAMAAGVPVIASNTGGLPEIVEHDETGLLTENAPEAIAGAIRRLMRDRAFAQSLAARARAMVERKFSCERMVADTISVYEALA